MPVRCAQQIPSQGRIRDASSRHHPANAENNQRQRTFAPLRSVEIGMQNLQQLFQHVLIRRTHAARAARHIGGQPDQGAAMFPVIEVSAREVSIDDSLRPSQGRCTSGPVLPRLCRIGAEEPSDGLGVKLLLRIEVPIEPAMRQPRAFHDFADRHLLESLAVEQPAGAFEDPLTRGKFVLSGIGHADPPSRGAKCTPTE
jgi:hypothetical protein